MTNVRKRLNEIAEEIRGINRTRWAGEIPPKLKSLYDERNRIMEGIVCRAKSCLNPGDRIGARRCPGERKVQFTFARWSGNWIVSASGVDDISPGSIYQVNGVPVDFLDHSPAGAAIVDLWEKRS